MLTFDELYLSRGRLSRPTCFSTKAWYAAFLLSKNPTSAVVSLDATRLVRNMSL
jgi:hypothetical protein